VCSEQGERDRKDFPFGAMDKGRKLIIAGNWKMNKTAAEALDLVQGLKRELGKVKVVDIVVCPPFTALDAISKAILNSNIRLGAQNMSEQNGGAFTGEISAVMLKEFSVRYVILGHSERRQHRRNRQFDFEESGVLMQRL
jgi:triosephosphate isomerase